MELPLPNPVARSRDSFYSNFIQTRRRLKAVNNGGRYVPGPDAPMLSVIFVTFNHERYVAQALDSILNQDCDFAVEINAIDDASTDRTQEIIREYAAKYPGKINCYFNPKNIGHKATQYNTIRGFETVRGKYCSLLEGDDYWTDMSKLRKQIEFLEANPECGGCAHYVTKLYEDGRPSEHFLPVISDIPDLIPLYPMIAMHSVFHLSSAIYRNVFGTVPPDCFADPFSCEVTINFVYGAFGPFYLFKDYMSVYRVHDTGVFSGRSREAICLFHLHGYRRFALYMGPRHWWKFAHAIRTFCHYVLSSQRSGKQPKFSFKANLIFWAHYMPVIPLRFLNWGFVYKLTPRRAHWFVYKVRRSWEEGKLHDMRRLVLGGAKI
jgi:glycosyltransferase involved in cell wall biosynthesis